MGDDIWPEAVLGEAGFALKEKLDQGEANFGVVDDSAPDDGVAG